MDDIRLVDFRRESFAARMAPLDKLILQFLIQEAEARIVECRGIPTTPYDPDRFADALGESICSVQDSLDRLAPGGWIEWARTEGAGVAIRLRLGRRGRTDPEGD